MSLTTEEREFVENRSRKARWFPYVIGGVLVLLAAVALYLWFEVPYLVDPWFVASQIKDQNIADTTLVLMAVMLPVVVLFLIAVMPMMLIFCVLSYRNERRLIGMVEKLAR